MSVVLAFLVVVVLALAVIAVVAVPKLQEGSPVLTEEGGRLARTAQRRASELADRALDAAQSLGVPAGGNRAEADPGSEEPGLGGARLGGGVPSQPAGRPAADTAGTAGKPRR